MEIFRDVKEKMEKTKKQKKHLQYTDTSMVPEANSIQIVPQN